MNNSALGQQIEPTQSSWVSTATRDAIRHFAWGVGDNNPLWTDIGHANASRWVGLIAPPCFLYGVHETSVAPGHAGHRRVYCAVDWTFFDVVRVGDQIGASAWLANERRAGDTLEQPGHVAFFAAGNRLVATADTICQRPTGPAIAYEDMPEIHYTGDELNEIERTILGESRQGDVSLNWEATKVGDTLGPLIKGPLSIMDVVAWCAATSGVTDESSGHSDGGLQAQSATGPEQVAWIAQLVTDWMGDDAFLHRLTLELEGCPSLGSTTTMKGQVVEVGLCNGQPCATISLLATDQSGRATAKGTAIVLQPSTEHGPVKLPLGVDARP